MHTACKFELQLISTLNCHRNGVLVNRSLEALMVVGGRWHCVMLV